MNTALHVVGVPKAMQVKGILQGGSCLLFIRHNLCRMSSECRSKYIPYPTDFLKWRYHRDFNRTLRIAVLPVILVLLYAQLSATTDQRNGGRYFIGQMHK